jgi:predicted flap endonuclease-1-like 5' DNA nuclease
MAMSALWFVLAGFVLGFAASTLWEWLHFRRSRMKLRDQRIAELEAELHEQERQLDEVRTLAMSSAGWSAPNYRSPGVFLDTETTDETTFVSAQPAQPAKPVPEQPAPLPAATAAVVANKQQASPNELQPDESRATTVSAVNAANSNAPELVVPPEPETVPLERAPEAPRPKAMPRSVDSPDNLSRVKGIGDVYKYRLYHAGIYTWWEVARSDPQTLRAATQAYPSSNVEEWPEQARILAEKHGRMHAVYTGPMPDDLTKIKGIGPVGAQVLNRAGICTYEQLMGVTVDELKELFPIAVAGDQPDFADWVRQAVEQATRKMQA